MKYRYGSLLSFKLFVVFILQLLVSSMLHAENGMALKDQGGGVLKLFSNIDKYNLVLGFASIDGDDEHLGYLALEHIGPWGNFGQQPKQTAKPDYSITRLAFKGEAFNYEHLARKKFQSGAKFDLYIGDTQIGSDYHWQALGFGVGYIYSSTKIMPALHLTMGVNLEPGFFKFNDRAVDQIQSQSYAEAEYFFVDTFGLTARFDSIYSSDGIGTYEQITDLWFGIRLFF